MIRVKCKRVGGDVTLPSQHKTYGNLICQHTLRYQTIRLERYFKEHNLERTLMVEEYFSDPVLEKDPAEWRTDIHFVLKP